MKTFKFISLIFVLALALTAADEAYLFTSFRKNGQDGLYMAYSHDGLKWTPLKGNKSFLKPVLGKDKLMRDPCIIQGPKGDFHMVWTTGWWDKHIGIAHSKDLINWSEQKLIPVMEHESKALNSWAPEIVWCEKTEQYVIYWATTIPGKFPETDKSGDKGRGGRLNHRMYYVTTKDFKTYSDTKILYNPGFNVIDSVIVKYKDGYVMVTKDETRHPAQKNLHMAVSKSGSAVGPWEKYGETFSPMWVEGPTVLKVKDEWFVYYDEYTRRKYGYKKTKDFKTWEDGKGKMTYPKGMRHGTTLPISLAVLDKLLQVK